MTEPMQYDVQLYPVLTVIKFRGKRFAPPAVLTLNEEEAAPLIAKGYLGGGTPMPEAEPQDPPAPESESANAAGLDDLGDLAQVAEAAAAATADHASYADMPEPAAVADSLDQAELQTEPGEEGAADAPASHGEDQPEGEPAAQAPSSTEDAEQKIEAAVEATDETAQALGQDRPAGRNRAGARSKGR